MEKDQPDVQGKMPIDDLATFKSSKVVRAGEIIEVVPAGCYVQSADPANSVLRIFEENMTTRYQPQVGDPDGYQSISPRQPFLDGYSRVD